MGNKSFRYLAMFCPALLLATASSAQTENVFEKAEKYRECVIVAAKKLVKSGEAADVVADAALADLDCSLYVILMKLHRQGGPRFVSSVQAEARLDAINAVVVMRSQQPARKNKK
jgi:hypothetical protein